MTRLWLSDLRESSGYTMLEVAKKLGISESYYCNIEKGNRQKNMDMQLMVKIADIFHINITEIVKWEADL